LAGYQINCGAGAEQVAGNVTWLPDARFIAVGNATDIPSLPAAPMLSSLRYFPDASARKHCYVLPAAKSAKYLIRTTYYYGGFDGGAAPPVFDQIIDGTRWSQVDTAADYAAGRATYFEAVVVAAGKAVSVCLARNAATASGSSPFISALEVVPLDDSVYNATDFASYALSTIARHSFGHDGSIIRYVAHTMAITLPWRSCHVSPLGHDQAKCAFSYSAMATSSTGTGSRTATGSARWWRARGACRRGRSGTGRRRTCSGGA
jgi:hypothetical protein